MVQSSRTASRSAVSTCCRLSLLVSASHYAVCPVSLLQHKILADHGAARAHPPVWFSDFTMLDDGTKTTIAEDSPFRTYMDINLKPIDPDPRIPDRPIDIYENHPWKHPGKAPVWSPCGIGGGNPRGCFVPGTQTPTPCPAGAASHGKDARFFEFPDVKTTVWKIGGIAETAWQVNAK